MARRERTTGAGENHRLPVVGVLDQCQDLAFEAALARRQNSGGIAVVAAVDDQRPCLTEIGLRQYAFIEIAMDHAMPLQEQVPRFGLVFINDHGGNVRLLELGDQGRHGRTVVEDDHMIARIRRLLRQLCFEAFFKQGNQEHRQHQEDHRHPEELGEQHEQDHHRMLPGSIHAVAGGRGGAGRPLQGLPEIPCLALEMLHAEHVEQGQHDQDHDQHADQGQKAVI